MRTKFALFFLIASLFGAAPAAAQSSCPYITYGAVLTAAQWQSCFQAKQDSLFGQGSSTTVLHGGAGNPIFGPVVLSTDVSGSLPLANINATGSRTSATYLRGDGQWATPPGAGAGGSNTQVQYNNSGSFGGITGATTNGTTLTLASPALTGTVTGNNTIPLAILAQGAANTMVGNWTGSTANFTAVSMPSCVDSGGNHLNYVNGTGIICGTSNLGAVILQAYISGLQLSTAGSSSTMTFAPGIATDSTNMIYMTLAASISKTTSAWTVGDTNGCLDTGLISSGTSYHFFEIEKTDLSVVDILCSLSATSPTMPSGYSYKRRIGSMTTDGSSHWTAFHQDGGWFYLVSGTQEASNVAGTGTWALQTLADLPTGVSLRPILGLQADVNDATTHAVAVQSATFVPSGSYAPLMQVSSGLYNGGTEVSSFWTNTSRQIYMLGSTSNLQYTLFLSGWYDARGMQ